MNLEEKLIDGIYNNVLPFLLEGVSPENQNDIKSSYKAYLKMNYANTLEPEDDLEQVISIFSITEVKKWHQKPEDYKVSQIVVDESLRKLRQISEIGYKHAQRKLGCIISNTEYIPSLTEENIILYINEMTQLHENVKPQNNFLADMYLSEGIIDFNYAVNLDEKLSLRTSKLM